MRSIYAFVSALLCVLILTPALAAQAPAPAAAETATQFYTKYLEVFAKAKKVEDVLPYMSAEMNKQVQATPAAQRPQMFEMIKMMSGMNTGIKITKETRTAKGATLTAEATDMEKKKVTGTIEILREGTAWKLGKEEWK